ncbi:glucose 1-dehydrogenase [Azohydromonas caseinilytica]|uniref:Glucose 1-dehydrogenase n=1 Tax=Azohydromonas caseinilytica TaxID=2728836 RepID=A0A848FFS8_9BURK|nr:glucose 1-dehydrogenase [Azohydromonas caseinilytica]NML17103.1 glucose 1-dehydrogenase [Azohydromonas caseinilytica]
MHIGLQRQVALVTGASSGIGAGVAEALAEAGAAVVLNYRSQREPAEALARRIVERGGQAIAVGADVGEEAAVERLFEAALNAFGRLDILVANAGLQRDAPFGEMTLAQWTEVLNANLTGQFLCARAAVRQFRRQGVCADVSRAAGKIIHMSSVHEFIPWAGHVNYAASKGGVKLLMQSLAQEVAAERIRVNGIAPGAIATAINSEVVQDPLQHRKLLSLIPYGRVGEVEDVARAAVWLASDASDYVVGATLVIDGGMGLYPGFRDGG